MPKNPHANFTPSLDGYTGQGAFRFWCQMALPLTYDDSLSYYELLNKVVKYLNSTISDVSAVEDNVGKLNDAYVQLQNYVNNYFDELDVEAELRNVLDAMALDGTLDELLDPIVADRLPGVVEDQIDGVVAEQIDNSVAGQIDDVVSEQLPPLVADSVPDNVTDWLDENVDPVGSAVIVDKTLTIDGAAADAKIVGNELEYLNKSVNIVRASGWSVFTEKQVVVTPTNLNSVTLDENNRVVPTTASSNGRYVQIDATAGDKFTIKSSATGSSIRCYAFIKSNGDIISRAPANTTLDYEVITAPANTAYLIVNDMTGNGVVIIGEFLETRVSRLEDEVGVLTGNSETTTNKLTNLNTIFEKTTGNVEISGWSNFTDKQGVNLASSTVTITDGHVVAGTASVNVRYVEVSAKEGDQFIVYTKGSGSLRTYGFISSTGTVLEVAASRATTLDYDVITAPSSTAFLVLNDVRGDGIAYYGKLVNVEYKSICNKSENLVNIYVPTSNKKFYIHYKLVKVNNPDYSIDRVANYAVGWRLMGIELCNLAKVRVSASTIMGTGEWETAIGISNNGSTIFAGLGDHGYEMQVDNGFTLYIDGKEIDEDDVFNDIEFNEIQLINKLRVLDPRMTESPDTIAYHTRIDSIEGSKRTITISNKVEFVNETSIPINHAYLFMSSLQRKYPANSDNLITDKFIDNVDYNLTDCSTQTFVPSNSNHGVGEHKPRVTNYKFWGEFCSLWGYAQIIERETNAPRVKNIAEFDVNTAYAFGDYVTHNDVVYAFITNHSAGNEWNENEMRIVPIAEITYNQFLPSSWVQAYENQNKIYMSICSGGDAISGDIWRMKTEFFLDSGYSPV